MVTAAMKLKDTCSRKKSCDQPRQHIKKQRHHFAEIRLNSKLRFFSSHVWMWELEHKEGWALKNWCFWTVVLEKSFVSPLGSRGIKLVNSKGNQSWIFIGRTDAKAEAPILWSPDAKNWLTGKDPDAGKDWRQKEKGTTEDGMVGWHHWLDGHEFEQALGVGDEQGGLACCSPWDRKESDMTEWLSWTELKALCPFINWRLLTHGTSYIDYTIFWHQPSHVQLLASVATIPFLRHFSILGTKFPNTSSWMNETGSLVSPYKSWFAGLVVSWMWALMKFLLWSWRMQQCRSMASFISMPQTWSLFQVTTPDIIRMQCYSLCDSSSSLCFSVLNEVRCFCFY